MKILVTGAAGFIGSHLCERLTDITDTEIVGLDNFDPFYPRTIKENNLENLRQRKNFNFLELDLRNIGKNSDLVDYQPDL